MKEHGTQYTCDRCGTTVFVPDIKRHDAYGDYTMPAPGAWSTHGGNDLCPQCTEIYNDMMNRFYAPEVRRKIDLES